MRLRIALALFASAAWPIGALDQPAAGAASPITRIDAGT